MIHKMYALYNYIPQDITESLNNEYGLEMDPNPSLKVITFDFNKVGDKYDFLRSEISDYDSGKNTIDYFYKRSPSNTVSPFLSLLISGNGLQIKANDPLNPKKKVYSSLSKDYKKILRILQNNVEINPDLKGLLEYFEESSDQIIDLLKGHLDDKPKKPYLFTIRIDGLYIGQNPLFDKIKEKLVEDYYKDFYTLNGEKVIGKDLVCSMCLQKKEELWGYVSIYNFYAAKTEYAPIAGGFDKKKAYKNFPVCPECAAKLQKMRPVIDKYFNFKFCDYNYFLIPEIVSKKENSEVINSIIDIMVNDNYSSTYLKDKIRLGSFTLGKRKKIVDADTKEIFDYLAYTKESASYTMIFYRANNAKFEILMTIEDIFPYQFKKIFEAKEKAENHSIFKNILDKKKIYDLEFRFDVLNEFFPKPKENNYSNYFLEITRKIFVQQPISYNFMLQLLMNVIRKEFLNKGKYEDSYKLYTLKAFLILKFMSYLDIIPTNKELIIMEDKMNEKFQNFFEEHYDFFDSNAKKYIFMLGVLTQNLINIQFVDKNSKPFRKRLNGLKLNKELIQRIFTEVIEKLEEYDKNYYTELEHDIAKLMVKDGIDELSNDEISFFFTLGMALNQDFKEEKAQVKDQEIEIINNQLGGNHE